MSLIVERLEWIYARVRVHPRTRNVYGYGFLVFDAKGKLTDESWAKSLIGKVEDVKDTSAVKRLVLKEIQGDLERTLGLRYEIDPDRIILVNKDAFEKVAKRFGSSYHKDIDKFKNVRRPLTVYFSPFRSASTGKVRSKHTLVIDIDGKVVTDWTDPRGWVIGFTMQVLTNPRALKTAREFLASNGLVLEKKDRVYRLSPRAMKNKLEQFGLSEDSAD